MPAPAEVALLIENLALRQQLAAYQRRGARPRLRARDRRFWSLLARTWPDWRSSLLLVQPEPTVIRWHRSAWRRYWTWRSRKRGRGRPRIDPALRQLIQQLARENPRWGVVRIVGELRALGYEVSAARGMTTLDSRRTAQEDAVDSEPKPMGGNG